MSNPPNLREAYARMQHVTLSLPHPGLTSAIARFSAHPDAAFKMALAREIAQTRASELTLAYDNVLAVAAGWRLRRTPTGKQKRVPTPCVVLLVERKWKKGFKAKESWRALPRHLLIGAEQDGERVLFAVPTDVQLAKDFVGARAQNASVVQVDDPVRPISGTVTCMVEVVRTNGDTEKKMLSAMHVFTPYPEVNTGASANPATVNATGHAAIVGTTSMLRGRITRDGYSFDAQLADINDMGWLTNQLSGLQLDMQTPYVSETLFHKLAAVGATFEVRVADNHPGHGSTGVRLHFGTYAPAAVSLNYSVRMSALGGATNPNAPVGVIPINQWEIIQFDIPISERLLPGDSGAPVIAYTDTLGPFLVGMFIASRNNIRRAYVIPAWELFLPFNWNQPNPVLKRIVPVNV